MPSSVTYTDEVVVRRIQGSVRLRVNHAATYVSREALALYSVGCLLLVAIVLMTLARRHGRRNCRDRDRLIEEDIDERMQEM